MRFDECDSNEEYARETQIQAQSAWAIIDTFIFSHSNNTIQKTSKQQAALVRFYVQYLWTVMIIRKVTAAIPETFWILTIKK